MNTRSYRVFMLCLPVLAVASCAPYPPPSEAKTIHGKKPAASTPGDAVKKHRAFRPFGDGEYWVLLEPIPYHIDATGHQGSVPVGFVTNFANVPRIFQWIIKPYGDHGLGAIVHDHLYWIQPGTRRDADIAFYELMKKHGSRRIKRNVMYTATRWFGAANWKVSAKHWHKGMRMVIPQKDIDHIPVGISWSKYKKQMFKENPAVRKNRSTLEPMPDHGSRPTGDR